MTNNENAFNLESIKNFFNIKAVKLASVLYNVWRKPRLLEDGTYEPKIKNTSDGYWILFYGTDKVDIANTEHEDLPTDWQESNKFAAIDAIGIIVATSLPPQYTGEINDEYIEMVSSYLHDAFISRRKGNVPDKQKVPYSELSEELKELDRNIIREAIKILS